MSYYLINYDLIRDKDYSRIQYGIDATTIKSIKVLFSTWLVESDMSAFDLTVALLKFIDADDKILVSGVDRESIAWLNIEDDASRWLLNI